MKPALPLGAFIKTDLLELQFVWSCGVQGGDDKIQELTKVRDLVGKPLSTKLEPPGGHTLLHGSKRKNYKH